MKTVVVFAALLMLAACTNQYLYTALEGSRASECNKVTNGYARQTCLDEARKPYEQYEWERTH